MINRYKEYLEFLDQRLCNMFEKQKIFIKCKEGCAHCCKNGEYPMSELEYIYMMFYYNNLDSETKSTVDKNIQELLSEEKQKVYTCPFLIDDRCSVYPARSLICRAFGLLSYNEKKRMKVPFCVDLGLNYADVYSNEAGKITDMGSDGTEPVAFNVDRIFLRGQSVAKEFNLFFGDDKTMYEWLEEDFGKG